MADEGRLVHPTPAETDVLEGTRSLEHVLASLYPWARRIAFMLCRSPHDADDLVQEAFAAALRRPPSPITEPVVRAWLRTVLTRLHGRGIRSRAREMRALLRLDARPIGLLSESTHEVLATLRTLGARQRACVALYYLDDLPASEIALILGIAEGTVKAHLAQARARLRKSLDA